MNNTSLNSPIEKVKGVGPKIKSQLEKEQNKFRLKYSDLDVVKSETIKRQSTYREILAFTNISKI